MTARIHVGDTGTPILVTIRDQEQVDVDVSVATVKRLIFRGPSVSFARDAVLATDGTDGVIKYILQAADITVPGTWQVQAYIETPAGSWHSDLAMFQVQGNLI